MHSLADDVLGGRSIFKVLIAVIITYVFFKYKYIFFETVYESIKIKSKHFPVTPCLFINK
jgi:hypothetical protein